MDNNIHSGHRDRLRNLAHKSNFKHLEQHQLLELMLSYVIPRKDTNPIAHRLIKSFGSFAGVLDANLEDLIKVDGIGNKTAHFIISLKQFFYEYNKGKQDKKVAIRNTIDAVAYCETLLSGKNVEEFYVICIDNGNAVKLSEFVSSGTDNKTNVDVRRVTEIAFKSNTSNIIICHNHPTGNSTPSFADDKLTKGVLTALAINGINLLDHIIIGQQDYYSYFKGGALADYLQEVKSLIGSTKVMQKQVKYNKE